MRPRSTRSFSLSQKGFILILVPLVFELVILAVSSWLLHQLELESLRGQRSRNYLVSIIKVNVMMSTAISSMSFYCYNDNGKFITEYEKAIKQYFDEMPRLRQLCRTQYPERLDKVVKLDKLIRHALVIVDEARGNVEQSGVESIPPVDRFAAAYRLLRKIESSIIELIVEEQRIQQLNPDRSDQSRQLLKACNLVSVVLSVCLAVGLAIFFNRSTSSRLRILNDNTKRLAQDRPLNEPLQGADELAELDRTFHQMANYLQTARRKELAIIENAMEVICSFDRDRMFLQISPASLETWGYQPDELIGTKLDALVIEASQPSVVRAIEEAIKMGGRAEFDMSVRCADGSQKEMLWSVSWSAPEATMYAVVHDVTRSREIERFRKNLVRMVSHDLRSPMTSALSVIQSLQAGRFGEFSDSANNKLQKAERNLKGLMTLVGDLLDAEVIDSGRLELALKAVSFETILERACENVGESQRERGLRIVFQNTDLTIEVDFNRLVQVVTNLLSNAIKFSPDNGVIIVRGERLAEFVKIEVCDEGRGVPEEFQRDIFENYWQVRESDRTERGGTGLGLPICKSIVEAHGGEIGVTINPEGGSIFWFRLPIQSPGND